MKRRTFVATSGATLLAGCSNGDTDASQESTTVENTDLTTQREETASKESVGEIDIVETEWIEEGETVSFLIQNIGSTQSGSVNLVVRWFDESGDYIGNDQRSIPTLHRGSNWYIEVETTAPFQASEYGAYVEYESQYDYDDLDTHSIEINEEIPAVTGIVSHGQNGKETGIEILAVTYDSGWITHAGTVSDMRVPEEDWRFVLPLSQIATDENGVGDELELMFRVV
jgi:hypothetical protein